MKNITFLNHRRYKLSKKSYEIDKQARKELSSKLLKIADSINQRWGSVVGASLFNRSALIEEVRELRDLATEIQSDE
jgi:hypothetical protein